LIIYKDGVAVNQTLLTFANPVKKKKIEKSSLQEHRQCAREFTFLKSLQRFGIDTVFLIIVILLDSFDFL